ncbi:Mur ligase family protein [Leucobacter chromiireducens]|uniref:Lipid II isoglutaminyl synthase (glutamine-hydrolyzing) subunit MurT n=1 Tax=Leucobacter chromiireducens subsp. chromiireducens TaxID=660067 RepID=A0ABS1SVJ9_9MICO|nr:Mur ligase family protein [Leucobacter chromiireducens]MBL3690921.1 Mur ligase family protein [Leucobacter chromiireducens subsp. chromiireducens]
MRDVISALIGKSVRQAARLRGGGSAIPGLVVEKLDPGFLGRVLGRLPYGVVAVSGTNGKTTTTKMIVEMLEAQGLRVFTNRTGSNFSRGVVAAAVAEGSLAGRLDADIAVLELDEAHAMYFIDRVPPRFTLLLNVLRDQLDRFGEIDTTAKLLQRIADATSEGLVVNREDRLIREIGERTRQRSAAVDVREFGLSDDLLATFPSDDDFHAGAPAVREGPAGGADVTLVELGDHEAVFQIDDASHRTSLKLEGLYNTFNAAAALAVVRQVLAAGPLPDRAARIAPPADTARIVEALAEVRPAFGRGEQLELDGQPLELVLVKNPAGFRLGLASFAADGVAAMIAINDQYADGRDMSWLWDVDFSSLAPAGVDTVSGARAWDMALRLEHDDVPVGAVEEDLGRALAAFRERTMGQPRRIYCTYTAMLELRRALAELTDVEDIW